MKHYAGLDVSLEETTICVVDESGRIVKELRALSEPPALVAALEEIGLPLERVGLEACSLAAWLHAGRAMQPGETDIQGRVSRCGDELPRTALYKAAHSLLTRSKKWSSLKAWGWPSQSGAVWRAQGSPSPASSPSSSTACGTIAKNSTLERKPPPSPPSPPPDDRQPERRRID